MRQELLKELKKEIDSGNIVFLNDEGEELKRSSYVLDDSLRTAIQLFFKDDKPNKNDDFNFDKMREERKKYNEDIVEKIYKNVCDLIKIANKDGKNSTEFNYNIKRYPENVIPIIKKRLESKGFNVRVKDLFFPKEFKVFIEIIVSWT